VNLFDYVGSILSYLVVAVGVFGTTQFDSLNASELSVVISKNSFFCMYLINQFSSLIDLSSDLSDIAGYTHRIGQLLECFNKMSNEKDNNPWPYSDNKRRMEMDFSDKGVSLRNVSFSPPKSDQLLVKDLTMNLCHGKNILVSGKTGVGKSSLFRVIGNVWPSQGDVEWRIPFSPHALFFLPQKPYLVQGSLKEQVTYPLSPSAVSDHVIREALVMAEMAHLLDDRHLASMTQLNWYDTLSPGEVQKLGFARLFCHRPQYAC
jgi:ATP-binding cassette subfamily D (ALD) protein 4